MAVPLSRSDDTPILYFYDPEDSNGWLSTFSNHPILLDGISWPTVEHFFQGNKFQDQILRECIRLSRSPSQAKRLGQSKSHRHPEWSNIKEEIMLRALRAKFHQHPYLGKMLIETKNAVLVEKSSDDLYWGIGFNGNGLNRLGCLLMVVRDEMLKRGRDEG